MKDLKTYRDLFQASLDGRDIEFWSESRGKWVPTLGGWYFDSRNLDKEIASSGKYRIKPTKPSIDWSHVHPNFKYLARDESGSVYLYTVKPYTLNMKWDGQWNSKGGDICGASSHSSLIVGNCHWSDSLVERPVNEEK